LRSDGQSLLHPYRFEDNGFRYQRNNAIQSLNITKAVTFLPSLCFPFTFYKKYPSKKYFGFVEQQFNTTSKTFDRKFAICSLEIGSDGNFVLDQGENFKRIERFIEDTLTGAFPENFSKLEMIGIFFNKNEAKTYFFRHNQSIIYCQLQEVCIQ
jgi:hypothetical protein